MEVIIDVAQQHWGYLQLLVTIANPGEGFHSFCRVMSSMKLQDYVVG